MAELKASSDSELNSELLVGLVCAVGAETSLVIELLKERLECAGYEVQVIKISKHVIELLENVPNHNGDQYKRISSLMDAGNTARSQAFKNGTLDGDAILAMGVAAQIYARRAKSEKEKGESQPLPKTAFIIDSLKRPEEVQKLRLVYPSGFVMVGVHEEESRRLRHLTKDLGISETHAQGLIKRDREEEKIEHGQRVNKTFHLADFFVRVSDNRDRLRCDIQRMVELWFGNPFITPTFDEHAMFMAFSAALRSADLSRQVGAVITRDSQILSAGANDCPKAGGGLYWPYRESSDGSIRDMENGRDYMREQGDSNRAVQIQIVDQIIEDVKKSGIKLDTRKLNSIRKVLNKSVIRDLTEYGRVVHAEMEAILSCGRNGLSTVGTTLYCTTFPCHNCAKHIIAAGLDRVVYVEPYPKSKTLEFHDDSITTKGSDHADSAGRVKFHAFVGIGPRRFFDLFSMQLGSSYPLIRKNDDTGKRKPWMIEDAQLRIQMKPVSYLELETEACNLFYVNRQANVRNKPSENLMQGRRRNVK